MSKIKDMHIRITAEKMFLVRELAHKESRTVTAIIEKAIDNFLVSKKFLQPERSKE